MKAPADTSSEKVPLITKLAFGSGDVGPAVATAIMSFFLLYFLTDVARISPAIAGVILLINKIWDSINDPLIGMVSDRVYRFPITKAGHEETLRELKAKRAAG
jgi:GPH family glycoside/pentoside/hexuronide:cation symporter